MAMANSSRVLFTLSGSTALACSGYLFRDLADFSQWVIIPDRNDIFETFRNRNKFVSVALGSMAANTYATFAMKPKRIPTPAWAVVNGVSLFFIYCGYFNPSLMMRPKNSNAVYVPNSKILDLLKREETVIVTQVPGDDEPRAFPDSQVLRPHAARAGTTPSGAQVVMTYCGLTNLGIAYEIAPRPDGTEVQLAALTQLENNLILFDPKTGQVGQQINGIDETALVSMIGAKSYQETKRRPSEAVLKACNLHGSVLWKENPTWRMTLGNFIRAYPEGDVFVNDYRMFKTLKKPVEAVFDTFMDKLFDFTVYEQATNPNPIFPTLENIDPRLPPKEQVWAFNVGDDYVALTETYVRDGNNGVRNMKVGEQVIVASWDYDAGSLGIWRNPTGKPIKQNVDVRGRIIAGKNDVHLERVNTVKNGAFWCVVATFFPQIRVNPAS